MPRHGKNYRKVKELLEQDKEYTLKEAIELLPQISTTKFDSSCEVHMKLGVDPKHADQIVRDMVTLPHGTGKAVKIIAFVDDEKAKEAKDAGADEVGSEDLIDKIKGGWLDFDIAVASPDQMRGIGKIAKILGQKGLMPNPKSGTVTPEVGKVISELKKGKIEFRNDKLSNLHNVFGKVSFGEAKLEENLKTYVKAVLDAKPSGVKGTYIQSITITTSMGPGIRLDVQNAQASVR
jgi:large subunit ribosomal protein L1